MIFETHAHFDDEAFDEDRESLLVEMKENGIEVIVNIGVDIENSKFNVEFIKKYDFMYGTVGVHPNETANLKEQDMNILRMLAGSEKIIAIGEIGLDYHYDKPKPSVQKIWFEKQLELARELSMPAVIHSRDAAKDTLDMMKVLHAEEIGGVIHCFAYGKEMAREFLSLDYYLGIGGVITFKNAKKLKEVVDYVPIEKIVLETDAPYLAPDPFRGKRNSSLYLVYVAEAIAQIKGMSTEEVIAVTNHNAKKMYQLLTTHDERKE